MKGKKQIEDLRDNLFAQMERLNDPSLDFEKELKKAKAFVDIGSVIVESAKAETDFMRITKSKGSGFIPVSLPGNDSKQIENG